MSEKDKPDWRDLKRVAPLAEAEKFLSLSRDTIIRNHKDKLVRLSRRRLGISWENVLMIASGE